MSSEEFPLLPSDSAFKLTAASPPSTDCSGAISFNPEVHSFCGHCRELCLVCSCSGDRDAGRDRIFCNLPQPSPPENHPQKYFLLRWASLVDAAKAMVFNVHLFLRSEGDALVFTLQSEGQRLTSMVEHYITLIPSSQELPMLINALGFFPDQDQYPLLKGTPEQWCEALSHEARIAAQNFLSGDWACITRLGLLLLNGSFLASDPEQYPPDDPQLQQLYRGLKLLVKLYSDAFSEAGVRYCLDMERTESKAEYQFRERRAATSGKSETPLPRDQVVDTSNARAT